MISIDSKMMSVQILVNFTPKMMANPSFSMCEDFFSASERVLDANPIGCSVPSENLCDITTPTT